MNSSIDSSLEISLDSLDITFADVIPHVEKEKCPQSVQNYDQNKKNFVDKIIHNYLRHNLTLVCLEDFMELLNDNREPCDKLPTSKKQIMKLFGEHRDLFDVFFFVKCEECKVVTKINSECSNCNCARCDKILKTSETNFFVTIPIEQQIRKSVENNWSSISKFDTSGSKDGSYSDAHDGKILTDVLQQYKDSDVNILSLCLNIDGANKHKSNVLSLWPIQLMQNFLPPNIRFLPNNIIVAGLYYHKKKPNCFEYMLPLIDELNHLNDQKITMNIGGEDFIFKPVITHCSVDLPAKSLLQETKQFGSYDGCTYCDIHGEIVVMKNTNRDEDETNKKKKKQLKNANPKNVETVDTSKKLSKIVRFVEGDQEPKLRDEVETLKTMLAVSASKTDEAVSGIKDARLLELIFIETNEKTMPDWEEVIIGKKINEFWYTKFFYDDKAFDFPRLCGEEVDEAERMLHKFVKQHQDLFGKESMVMVIHLLKHLGVSVRNLGPLWCHSTFAFERNNGCLLKRVNGTTDVLHQISSKYSLSKSLPNKVEKTADKTIFRGKGINYEETSLKVLRIDNSETLDLSNVSLIVHNRIKLGNTIYTSLLYTRPKKSIDYFIGLKDEATIGMARFYFEYKSRIYVLIEQFEVIDNIYHIAKVRKTTINVMAPVEDINKKYIFMKVGINQFIVTPPNPYENE